MKKTITITVVFILIFVLTGTISCADADFSVVAKTTNEAAIDIQYSIAEEASEIPPIPTVGVVFQKIKETAFTDGTDKSSGEIPRVYQEVPNKQIPAVPRVESKADLPEENQTNTKYATGKSSESGKTEDTSEPSEETIAVGTAIYASPPGNSPPCY